MTLADAWKGDETMMFLVWQMSLSRGDGLEEHWCIEVLVKSEIWSVLFLDSY